MSHAKPAPGYAPAAHSLEVETILTRERIRARLLELPYQDLHLLEEFIEMTFFTEVQICSNAISIPSA